MEIDTIKLKKIISFKCSVFLVPIFSMSVPHRYDAVWTQPLLNTIQSCAFNITV
jgi:hypothetical protein